MDRKTWLEDGDDGHINPTTEVTVSDMIFKNKHLENHNTDQQQTQITTKRYFTKDLDDPFDSVEFERRTAKITNPSTGENVFYAEDLEFPKTWSENTTALVAEKYFRHVLQNDVKQMISRVADTIANWGIKLGYFPHHPTANGSTRWPVSVPARDFRNELVYMLVNQMAAFNSPVWFNVGTTGGKLRTEQISACFINSLEDNMQSILQLAVTEGTLYKGGSGSGVNYSNLRSSREKLSWGGYSCLTDDTQLYRPYELVRKKGKKWGVVTIGELYKRKLKGRTYKILLRCMDDEGNLTRNKIADIVHNGVDEVFEITTARGYKIKANARHRFLTYDQTWMTVSDFKVSDSIGVNGAVREVAACQRCNEVRLLTPSTWKHSGVCEWCYNTLRKNPDAILRTPRQVDYCSRCSKVRILMTKMSEYEGMCMSCASSVSVVPDRLLWGSDELSKKRSQSSKRMWVDPQKRKEFGDKHRGDLNHSWKGLTASETTARQRIQTQHPELWAYARSNDTECHWCGKLGEKEIHHLDHSPYNNDISNLAAICILCHSSYHATARRSALPPLSKSVVDFDTIVSIVSMGSADVYDVVMEAPYHNFIANGFVSHNSGPVSFIAKDDATAGSIKSGGFSRRAAKISILNADHGDIKEFITCKAHAEKAAHALIDANFDGDFRARWGAYQLVPFQNANHSVRVTDEFMKAVHLNKSWDLVSRDGKEILETLPARELWDMICEAAHVCGDPGLQFDTISNKWHTCPESGRINGSNPCQPGWATVLTREGIKTFDDITIDSVIWSGKQWTKVVNKVATGVKPVYRFQTTGGVFVGTENHKIISNGERVEAGDADTIDTATGPVSFAGVIDMQSVVDGLVFGDGYVKISNDGKDHYPLLCVGENDISYFDDKELSEFINSKPFDKYSHRVKTTLQAEELPKTYNRKIPQRFAQGAAVQMCSFLRGLYSANGSVVANRVTLKATSFTVISQVQSMLSALGIRSYYTTNKSTDITFSNGTYTSKESYDLNISTSSADFSRLIGFIQPYKQEKLNNIITDVVRRPKTSYEVISREFLGEEPVFDITVEAEEHTYWTGGLLVSNCSEYFFLDDTSCNLSSLNLMKFYDYAPLSKTKTFLHEAFSHTVDVMITAMEILVGAASYPTPKIEENSHKYRTLGLGYTNLGALFMSQGLPYDSDEACELASNVTALLTARAYSRSAEIAAQMGPFESFEQNRTPMLNVLQMHKEALTSQPSRNPLWKVAINEWDRAITLGQKHGYRNAQATVLAPSGTISHLMGADTTGVEPELNLVKYKKLVGGGTVTIANQRVNDALVALGYTSEQRNEILRYVTEYSSVVGSGVKEEHYPVFDSSFPERVSGRFLRPEAHVNMMAAVQPFISGSVSKTVNVPSSATKEDIGRLYFLAWTEGLKSVALYRDGSKRTQPLNTSATDKVAEQIIPHPVRRKLPADCEGPRHKFNIGNHEGYIHVGLYEDGTPGEVFVKMSKEGSTVSGLMDTIATLTSLALQYGVPLQVLVDKFSWASFEPSGFTSNPEIGLAKSPIDYLYRWLGNKFKEPIQAKTVTSNPKPEFTQTSTSSIPVEISTTPIQTGGTCDHCGGLTQRAGACSVCTVCGQSTGCG
jgi:ribonucleoside-diphosphate reductase alpha chain